MIGVILTNKITASGCATTFKPISVFEYPRDSRISESSGINVPSFIPIMRAHKKRTRYVLYWFPKYD